LTKKKRESEENETFPLSLITAVFVTAVFDVIEFLIVGVWRREKSMRERPTESS
jgi:hypothetical protein